MAYATIDEILSRVDHRSPYPPGQFPDFDPEDLKAWEKVMSYSARRLYPYADPWERPGGPNVVASGDQEDGEDVAFILPDITLLYLEANREWQQVFGDI